MHRWQDPDGLIAGKDLQAGGTWLGVNSRGQFAAITNFRTASAAQEGALSRGKLVVDALSQPALTPKDSPSPFDLHLDQEHHRYNPFNLVFGDISLLQAWDYRSGARRPLARGFHSVSNGPIDEPWPKMSQGVAQIAKIISHQDDLDLRMLTITMRDQTRAPLSQLPQIGVTAEKERALSSIFIEGQVYGTRTTTILLFEPEEISILETNYNVDTTVASTLNDTVKL
nr:transport and Golgi organization protein 2 homolog [Nerophis lumbriciformis]